MLKMRSPLDLLDLPYTFWQLRLLTEDQFRREAKARGVHLFERQLEGFHRLRVLTPFLRVSRDGRAIAAAARRKDPDIWERAHWQPTHRADLLEAREAGRLHDPVAEHFIARRRLQEGGRRGHIPFERISLLASSAPGTSSFAEPPSVPPLLTRWGGQRVRGQSCDLRQTGRAKPSGSIPRLIALSALEPIYYPSIIRRIRYNGDELSSYDIWRNDLRPRAMLDWLEVEPAWIKDSAGTLLDQADGFDPLGQWSELTREADPDRWQLLQGRGTKRHRFAHRRRGSLRVTTTAWCGDELRRRSNHPSGRWRDQFSGRLKPQGGLDKVLTNFGLSPHPQLVLLVEGETELFLFPRLMELFGIRKDRDFIAIENAQGVGRDISALIAYAVRAGNRSETAMAITLRPAEAPDEAPCSDGRGEGTYATAEGRKERRKVWVKRILQTLPPEDRTGSGPQIG